MTLKLRHWGPVVLSLIVLFALLFRLDSVPPLWWDEGWTLSIARNWFERGHYGRLLAGEFVPAGLQAAPIVTAAVSLSFSLFGMGVVQARMVTVLFTLAVLALMYTLSRHLYNRPVAWGTLLVLFFMPGYIELFPIYAGRQVLGEIPALFFLLAGYASMLSVVCRPRLAVSLATLCWAIALSTKLQVVPFWVCSILIPLSMLVLRRDWKLSYYWAVAFCGALVGSRILPRLWEVLLQSNTDIAAPISGLYEVTAIVGSIPSRLFALIVTVLFGIPTLLGLCYGFWVIERDRDNVREHVYIVRFSLLVLSASWFVWFVFFSVGWIRYIFPATFIGSMSVAAMIYDLTNRFDMSFTIKQSLSVFRYLKLNKQNGAPLLATILIAATIPRTAMAVYKTYILDADTSVQEAAAFLNTRTKRDALIETYDSELFFLLDRAYHYPPDQVHVDLIRRTFLYEEETRMDYDPLAADPDYLVIGPHSKQWRLYDQTVNTGAFRLVRSYSRYKIYERVR
jgi:4-amino-4-deoxy-L-arabinose transferase-like glycosyltransferase